ncbi:MAG: DnaA regulatory inactivator Hda [Gammaproteobacteria bacterium]|nr:DnaA regulatory inactivator Hda [Gammaproteobacteria bacterium]
MSGTSGAGRQLPLDVRLRDGSSFDNFYGLRNREALAHIRAAAQRVAVSDGRRAFEQIFLWGRSGCGKTHLLEAAARLVQEQGRAPAYVPLAMSAAAPPDVLEGLDSSVLVCLDDVQAVGGNRRWESGLMQLYERVRLSAGLLLVTADAGPGQLEAVLPDLATRLSAGLAYRLQPLADEDKLAALCLRARNRGLDMSEEVARYVLSRYPRDPHALFRLLDRIDQVSLATQRRLTIPFLRILQEQDHA